MRGQFVHISNLWPRNGPFMRETFDLNKSEFYFLKGFLPNLIEMNPVYEGKVY